MKDDALIALLPQAFARRASCWVWIDPEARLLALGVGNQGKADKITTSLMRVAGGGSGALALALLQTQTSPQAAMASWLASEDGAALHPAFAIERECELKGSGEESAVVRFARHPLETPEVRQHIQEGKLPTRLALGWAGRMSLVLTQALQLKKLRYADGLFDKDGQSDNRDERFDADAALATGELSRLIPDLIEALGGEMNEMGEPGSAAPAATPAAAAAVQAGEDAGPPF